MRPCQSVRTYTIIRGRNGSHLEEFQAPSTSATGPSAAMDGAAPILQSCAQAAANGAQYQACGNIPTDDVSDIPAGGEQDVPNDRQ